MLLGERTKRERSLKSKLLKSSCWFFVSFYRSAPCSDLFHSSCPLSDVILVDQIGVVPEVNGVQRRHVAIVVVVVLVVVTFMFGPMGFGLLVLHLKEGLPVQLVLSLDLKIKIANLFSTRPPKFWFYFNVGISSK